MPSKTATPETRRQYLVRKGLAQAGGGRFSAAAHAEIAKAEAAGVVFTDSPRP